MRQRTNFVHFGRPNRIVLRQHGSRAGGTPNPADAAAASVSTRCFPKELYESGGSTCCAPGSYLVRTRLLPGFTANCEPAYLIYGQITLRPAHPPHMRPPVYVRHIITSPVWSFRSVHCAITALAQPSPRSRCRHGATARRTNRAAPRVRHLRTDAPGHGGIRDRP